MFQNSAHARTKPIVHTVHYTACYIVNSVMQHTVEHMSPNLLNQTSDVT